MQKSFTKNIFLLLGINLIIKPIYILGIDAKVQDSVGDETYGVYFALFNLCFLFKIFLDLGIYNFNAKYVSQNNEKVSEHFADVVGLKLALTGCFAIVVTVVAHILGYSLLEMKTLWLITAFFVLQSFFLYLRAHFSNLGFYAKDSVLSAVDKLLMIFIIGYFIYKLQDIDIHKFILGQIAALSIACAITLMLLSRKFSLSIRFSYSRSMAILKQSLPFALVIVLMSMYTRMDGVMLERILDDNGASAGMYARGYRILDAANILGYLFASLLIPMFAKQLKENEDINNLLHKAVSLLLSIATIISIFCWWYAYDIMHLIYRNITTDHIEIFRILMVSFWSMSISYIFGSLINATGKLKLLNILFLAGIAINWILNMYWIPMFGGQGAAYATLITQTIVFIGQVIIVIRQFSVSFTILQLSKMVAFIGITWLLFSILYKNLEAHWMIQSLIAVSLSLTVSFLLGFIRLDLTEEN